MMFPQEIVWRGIGGVAAVLAWYLVLPGLGTGFKLVDAFFSTLFSLLAVGALAYTGLVPHGTEQWGVTLVVTLAFLGLLFYKARGSAAPVKEVRVWKAR